MYNPIFEQQKARLPLLKAQSVEQRITKLKALKKAVQGTKESLFEALQKDLRKSPSEAELTEYAPMLDELDFTISHLSRWMKPARVRTPLKLLGGSSQIRHEPKGQVLIIGPWNYPFYLMITPLISAVAAGNSVILKPSEHSPNTGKYLSSLVSSVFDESEVACVQGDQAASQELLKLPFNHIFFTGSPRVGKIVMAAAAQHLASVTLELGGKSPAIVEESAHLPSSALRIIWGKLINAGQTCVAPDYVFVPESRLSDFTEEAKKSLAQLFGGNEEDREKSPDFCRIINSTHYERLRSCLLQSIQEGAKVETGGVFRPEEKYFAPTLLTQVGTRSSIMKAEIFGPILPILTYRNLEEVYRYLRENEKPLALYIFSQNEHKIEEILRNTNAGGTAINNTLLHLANPNLPFGGAGQSGLGNYHGFFGFKTFSHERAIYRQGRLSILQALYPPYKPWVQKTIQTVTRLFN